MRQAIAVASASTLPDGGTAGLAIPPHVGPIVDARGAVAFAAPDAYAGGAGGEVGVVSAGGALDVLGEPLCARPGASGGIAGVRAGGGGLFAGVVPAGPSAFVVACESGVVARIVSE